MYKNSLYTIKDSKTDSKVTDTKTESSETIKSDIKAIAENTEKLSGLAKDMSSVKENIKKSTGRIPYEPESRAERYFARAKKIEDEYEEKFKKVGGSSTEKITKEKEKKSWLENLFSGIGSMLLKGGLIVGAILAIKEYFTTPEFRSAVNGLLEGFFKAIVPFILDYWKEILIGLAILKPISTIMTGINLFSMVFSAKGKFMKVLLGIRALFGIGSLS